MYRLRKLPLYLGIVILMSVIVVLAAPTASAKESALTDYVEVLFSNTSGIPTNEANTIVETSDGYIWIGGYGGLLRYDGRTFDNFSRGDTGMTSSSIRALFEDSRGTLWVGTNEQGVFYYHDGRFYGINDPGTTEFLSVRCFAEVNGTVYVGTSSGLARIDKNTIVPMDIPELDNNTVYTLSTDSRGGLWGVEYSGALFCIADDALVSWFAPGQFWQNYAYCAVVAEDDSIYVGTNTEEVVALRRTGSGFDAASFEAVQIATSGIYTTNFMCLTDEGQMWLCAENGTGYIDCGTLTFHPAGYVQNAQSLCWMIQDHEGSLWMTSSTKGVLKLSRSAYSNLYANHPLRNCIVYSVYEHDGLFYVGTETGLFVCDSTWNIVSSPLDEYLSHTTIRHITGDKNGNIWLCTYYSYGAVRYTPATGEIKFFGAEEGITARKLRMILPLSNGDIAVSSNGGIDIIRGDAIVDHYDDEDGMDNFYILCMVEMSDGTLLAGSDGLGLYAIKDGVVTNYNRNIGFTGGVILHIIRDDRSDNLWISTGSELYYGNLTDGMKLTAPLSKGSGSIFDVFLIGDDVWVLRHSSVLKVDRAALLSDAASVDCLEFGQARGLSAPLVANSWSLLNDRTFYICTTAGVSVFNSVSNTEIGVVPIVVVKSVYADSTKFNNSPRITIDSSTQKITIDLSVLSYNQQPVSIMYCMDGFNSEWVTISHDSYSPIVYTNLSGGEYIFRYKAIGADGVMSDEEVLVIVKRRSLFERVWVWVVMGLLLAGAITALTLYIINAKLAKSQRIQQQYKKITDQGLLTIANTIDAKDAYTNGHSLRVAAYVREIAKRLELENIDQLYYIALLHDIGKIGIPDNILNKPGRLTDAEYDLVRRHTIIGGEILKDFTAVDGIYEGAMYHHERYDGTGYCNGLAGDEIPLAARIIAVADAYDAMTSARCYRPLLDRDIVESELRSCSGKQFDPKIAQVMLDMMEDGSAEALAEELPTVSRFANLTLEQWSNLLQSGQTDPEE